jgi:segregation and condensation protein B
MDENQIKYFVEAALLAAGRPLSIDQLQKLFDNDSMPDRAQIRQAISDLLEDYAERGITISEVASGFRVQVQSEMVQRLQRLWEERPPRYSRALFETLALIAYRQPVTRGEIEEIRGVTVSANIIRSLLEREWVRIVGHRDVPGRPEMFGTTRQFLDYFGLKKLEDLPPLAEVSDWESLRVQLNLPAVEEEQVTAEVTELPVSPLLLVDADSANVTGDTGEVEGAVEEQGAAAVGPEADEAAGEVETDSHSIEALEAVGDDDDPDAANSDIETDDAADEALIETASIEALEVVYDEDDPDAAESVAGEESPVASTDIDLAPIEASEWPDPNAGISRIAAADVDDLREDEKDRDDRDDPETSATGG